MVEVGDQRFSSSVVKVDDQELKFVRIFFFFFLQVDGQKFSSTMMKADDQMFNSSVLKVGDEKLIGLVNRQKQKQKKTLTKCVDYMESKNVS